jgi:hypothetical protein
VALPCCPISRLVVEGIDPIPPITDYLPDMPIAADYFGVFIPVGAPQEVYDTVDQVWQDVIMNSPELQAYASDRGAVFAPSYGEDALAAAMPVVIAEACARVTRGEAVDRSFRDRHRLPRRVILVNWPRGERRAACDLSSLIRRHHGRRLARSRLPSPCTLPQTSRDIPRPS